MKKRHVLGLLLLSVALSHALAPAIAWAQFKAQNAFYSLTVTDTVTASGDVTADQYVASGSASQYSCSKTDGTCQFSSATADGTTSSTVGSFTFKAGANINAADLLFDVQDSAGAHALTVTEAGKVSSLSHVQVGGGIIYFGGVENGAYIQSDSPSRVYNGVDNNWATLVDGATADFQIRSTWYLKAQKSFAGAPTGTDCDAAGELGRIAIDTTNHRIYWCEGAAGWYYANEDVP